MKNQVYDLEEWLLEFIASIGSIAFSPVGHTRQAKALVSTLQRGNPFLDAPASLKNRAFVLEAPTLERLGMRSYTGAQERKRWQKIKQN